MLHKTSILASLVIAALAACAVPKQSEAPSPQRCTEAPTATATGAPAPALRDAPESSALDVAQPVSSKPVTGAMDSLSPADARARADGLTALDSGDFLGAQDTFGNLLERNPGNVGLRALHEGARRALKLAQAGAGRMLDNVQALALPRPPFRYRKSINAPVSKQSRAPKLKKLSQKTNDITDDNEWFIENQVRLPVYELPNPFMRVVGNLPGEIATEYGGMKIVTAIDHGDHRIAMYAKDYSGGRFLAVTDMAGKALGVYDFVNWGRGPKSTDGGSGLINAGSDFVWQGVHWAQEHEGVLYVSSGSGGYATDSAGRTAFISAIDMKTGNLLWQSEPLVANAVNFLIREGWIITGYGFTAEPDFLFVLDMKTGKTKNKIKLKSGPSYILERDGKLFVRTYNTNYVFSID